MEQNADRTFKKLDPLKHISKINFEIDESVDLSEVKPFSEVDDSSNFVKELRRANWER